MSAKSLQGHLHCGIAFGLREKTLFVDALFVFFVEWLVVGARIFDVDADARFLTGHLTAGIREQLCILGAGKSFARESRRRCKFDVELAVLEQGSLRLIEG